MNKFHFVILCLFAFGFLSIQGKKEEKTAVAKANTNILEYVQLFKTLLNQALSKADFSSVRGMLSSPLSIGATAVSVLLGGIVLMAFYESPLSPLPVPPLPQAPVGRFPPENPIVAPMNSGINRLSSSGAMHFLNPEHLNLRDQRRRMLYSPVLQNQPYIYSKNAQSMNYPNIKRNDNYYNDYLSNANQMIKNLQDSHSKANKYNSADAVADSASPPSEKNSLKKDKLSKNSNDNLQTSESSGHVAFASPSTSDPDLSKLNSNNHLNSQLNNQLKSPFHYQFNNQLNNQLNQNNDQFLSNQLNDPLIVDQTDPFKKNYDETKLRGIPAPATNYHDINKFILDKGNKNKFLNNQSINQLNLQPKNPVYKPVNEASTLNENANLNSLAIKEENFDQRQVVNSQLSQIEFKTSPELAKLEENLKRSTD